ncbi:MAG: response regulator, partial [Candidatus Cloacimonetes bacterium]|nr:response regulator [Candidatus Cloacimonadota bacterium]
VFLDINLPEMSGMSFLKEINHDYPAIKVIMITGISSQLLQEKALESGAANYLRKPIHFSEIEEAIKQINKPNRREL